MLYVNEAARKLLDQANAEVRNAYIAAASAEQEKCLTCIQAAFKTLAMAEAEVTGEEPREV
jgi:hypothetical protein